MTREQAIIKLNALDAINYNPAVKSYELDGEKITFNSAKDFLAYRNFLVRIINSTGQNGSPFAQISVIVGNKPY